VSEAGRGSTPRAHETNPPESSSNGPLAVAPASQSVIGKPGRPELRLADIPVYLQGAPNFLIWPEPVATPVPRGSMRGIYGITPRSWVEQIPAGKNPTGPWPRTVWFLNSTEHPASPQEPGDPGLVLGFYSYDGDPVGKGLCSVFRKAIVGNWTYLGEYDNVYVEGGLSKEHFCALDESVGGSMGTRS
jgi:hypothetical protein